MKLGYKIGLALILVVLLILIFPFAVNVYAHYHNQRIDFSCNVDTDCVVKPVGDGVCHSTAYLCVNENSVKGIAARNTTPFMHMASCMALDPLPNTCRCESNVCVSEICFDEQCNKLENRILTNS